MVKAFININFLILAIFSLSVVSSCTEPDDVALKVMDGFFRHVLKNKDQQAAELVDTKAKFYKKRFLIINQIQTDSLYGQMKAKKNFGFFSRQVQTTSNFFVTTVETNYDVYYDSVHVSYQVKLIDRGDGFKIFRLRKMRVSKNMRI
ncbi:MAG: hypothetical protein ACK476_03230 [Fluviicola sp.]